MGLYQKLLLARSEEEVKDACIKAIGLERLFEEFD
jgi:hypothetical protein